MIHPLSTLLLAFGLFSLPFPGPQDNLPTLQSLLSEKEYRDYEKKPQYKKRLDIFRKAIAQTAAELRAKVGKKQLPPAIEELREIQALAHYGMAEPTRSAASPKDLRSGQVRKTEIRLRKLLKTLHDLELSVPYDHREDFAATSRLVEDWRNQLLKQIFGTP
jgi:hypothetical protein